MQCVHAKMSSSEQVCARMLSHPFSLSFILVCYCSYPLLHICANRKQSSYSSLQSNNYLLLCVSTRPSICFRAEKWKCFFINYNWPCEEKKSRKMDELFDKKKI